MAENASIKLPEFWPLNPTVWFAHAEARFRLLGVNDEGHRYGHLAAALPQETLRLVTRFLAAPDEDEPYTQLRDRLLNNHTLSDFQKIGRMFQLGPLGPQQQPTELLANIMELVPDSKDKCKAYAFMFLQRLPKVLRIQLGDDLDGMGLQDIAERADRL